MAGIALAAPARRQISIDEFMTVDPRVARISEATPVEGADKLLRLVLDLSPLGARRYLLESRQPTFQKLSSAG